MTDLVIEEIRKQAELSRQSDSQIIERLKAGVISLKDAMDANEERAEKIRKEVDERSERMRFGVRFPPSKGFRL